MRFSNYLDSQRQNARELVKALSDDFAYVGVLGTDVRQTVIRADKKMSVVRDGNGECGFVVKLHDGRAFYEYSTDDISGDKKALAEKIKKETALSRSLAEGAIVSEPVPEEELKRAFLRESDFDSYTDSDLLGKCRELSAKLLEKDEKILNAIVMVRPYTVSKLFVSKKRELSQCYGWGNGFILIAYADGKMVQTRHINGFANISEILSDLEKRLDEPLELARHLVKAQPIEPGVYDVITDSSISGLIAHEAFGHGVEMDQFVKDRALAKQFVGKYVASPITNMRDGAAATVSAASYFFDDDGVLAHDTQIIKDGVLVAGLSDLASAAQLGVAPSGNGRRDSYKRKAYSRMTNTFFEPGKDKLEDMIKSVKHGYMLFQTNNGMEDPKNWQIQCTAEYGVEIVDGKLTDNYVAPVVMSGSVPELLRSISMVSDEKEIHGSGMCGKGYKEWVNVSDGGPALKVRVKLG